MERTTIGEVEARLAVAPRPADPLLSMTGHVQPAEIASALPGFGAGSRGRSKRSFAVGFFGHANTMTESGLQAGSGDRPT